MGVRGEKTEIGSVSLGPYGAGLCALIHRVLWEIRIWNTGRTEVWVVKFSFVHVKFAVSLSHPFQNTNLKLKRNFNWSHSWAVINIEMSAFSLEEKNIWPIRENRLLLISGFGKHVKLKEKN